MRKTYSVKSNVFTIDTLFRQNKKFAHASSIVARLRTTLWSKKTFLKFVCARFIVYTCLN